MTGYLVSSRTSSNGWPLISIVIPTYNSAATIVLVLDSIENLGYPKDALELIIVDGCSTDDTVDIIKNHVVTKKIRTKNIVLNKRGASLGRNIGIKESKGDYLFLLDSDVVLTDSEILSGLLRHFQKDQKIAISEAPYFTKNMSLSETTIACRLPTPYNYTRYISPGSMLIRRSVFDEVGFFDETLGYPYAPGEDQEFAARILRKRYKIFMDTRFMNLHVKPKIRDVGVRNIVVNYLHFVESTLRVMPPVHYKIFRAGPASMKLEVLFALYPITFFLPLLNVYFLPLPILPFLYYLYRCKCTTSIASRFKTSLVLVTYRFIRSIGVLLGLTKKCVHLK